MSRDTDTLNMDGKLRPRRGVDDVVEAFLPSPCVQNHAANLMPLPNGDLGCVWFGGTQEGKGDISIYFARLPRGGDTWTAPLKLSDDPSRSEQNPILFSAPNGELWLLHTSQHAGNQNTSVVKRRISRDGGATWGPTDVLIGDPGTFVRQPLVLLPNGDWLLGCFLCRTRPGTKWLGEQDISVLKISSDQGRTWRDSVVPESLGLVHMNVVPAKGGNDLVAFFRSRWADSIYRSVSRDGGLTWTRPAATLLPNNNSSIQAIRLEDGRIAMIFNNSNQTDTTERRASLYDEIEDDDETGTAAAVPATAAIAGRQAFWGTPRAPVTVAVSSDDGLTWRIAGDLETGDGYCLTNNSEQRLNRELSYPSIVETADGAIHVAFTYHRRAIKHLRLPASHLAD